MNTRSRIITGSIAAAAVLSLAIPALAQVGVSAAVDANAAVNTGAANSNTDANINANASGDANGRGKGEASTTRTADKMQKGEDRGDTEVNARIDALNKITARINAMKNLSDSQKAAFASEIQVSVADMTSLVAKLQSDTTAADLKADLQTIAPDYRIYMLVVPQLSLLSAVDRAGTLVTSFQTIQAKIQSRVSADASLSSNTAITADLADMTAKLSDAASVSAAAQAEVSGLKPDQGDKTVMTANTAALKDARIKIQTAQKDFVAVRKDAGDAVKAITGNSKKINASASTTVSASATNGQ